MKGVLKSRRVFKGRLLNVFIERQRYPNGHIGSLEVVRHPGAVLIVPILDKRRLILLRQYRPVIHKYVWEFPAGTLEKGEGALSCARRELKEETGYSAKTWKKIGVIYPAPGYTTEAIRLFVAGGMERAVSNSEADELISVKICTVSFIARLVNSGAMVDAKTLCALNLSGIL